MAPPALLPAMCGRLLSSRPLPSRRVCKAATSLLAACLCCWSTAAWRPSALGPASSTALSILAVSPTLTACRRSEIDLCARLLTVAAHGLQENTGLLGFVVAAKVAMVGIVLPLGVLLTLSYTNGDLAPNRELAALHTPPWLCVSRAAPEVAAAACLDEGGTLSPVISWAAHICSPALRRR